MLGESRLGLAISDAIAERGRGILRSEATLRPKGLSATVVIPVRATMSGPEAGAGVAARLERHVWHRTDGLIEFIVVSEELVEGVETRVWAMGYLSSGQV
jgi:hypothetical protein